MRERSFSTKKSDTLDLVKMMVNLSNLKHLDLKQVDESHRLYLLMEVLQTAPQLSSLEIDPNNLPLLF